MIPGSGSHYPVARERAALFDLLDADRGAVGGKVVGSTAAVHPGAAGGVVRVLGRLEEEHDVVDCVEVLGAAACASVSGSTELRAR